MSPSILSTSKGRDLTVWTVCFSVWSHHINLFSFKPQEFPIFQFVLLPLLLHPYLWEVSNFRYTWFKTTRSPSSPKLDELSQIQSQNHWTEYYSAGTASYILSKLSVSIFVSKALCCALGFWRRTHQILTAELFSIANPPSLSTVCRSSCIPLARYFFFLCAFAFVELLHKFTVSLHNGYLLIYPQKKTTATRWSQQTIAVYLAEES